MSKLCKSFIFAVSLGRVTVFWIRVCKQKKWAPRRLRSFSTYLTALWIPVPEACIPVMGAASFFWKGHLSLAPRPVLCDSSACKPALPGTTITMSWGRSTPASCHVLSSAPCWSHPPSHILLCSQLVKLPPHYPFAWLSYRLRAVHGPPCSLFLPYQTCCLRPACPHLTWSRTQSFAMFSCGNHLFSFLKPWAGTSLALQKLLDGL